VAETFIYPDFVLGADAEEIQARMMEALPEDIDDMPGGFPWDFTMPTALVLSEFVQDRLVRALQAMFPQYSWGDWLDMHGQRINVPRRDARHATGTVRVTGSIGTVIPAGTQFCTPATDYAESILYTADEEAVILTGEVSIPVTAAAAGSSSNVMAGAISLAVRPVPGITSIQNDAAITDGTDKEDDETYRERILEYYRAELLFVGCPADYVRWAKEVAGVGNAVCIPEWNGPGTVKLVITDAEGEPASQSILADVYAHIAATPDSLGRLAPIGATLTVVAPLPVDIAYVVQVRLGSGYILEDVEDAIASNLEAYYDEAITDGELKYADCFAIITNTEGVYDATALTLNGGTANIPITRSQYPRTASLSVTAY
jgi:uncharacterized phage protein gp47/JayE